MDDERIYEQVVEELRFNGLKPGLWAKVFAETNGNEVLAKALYLRYRVAQLKEDELGLAQAKKAVPEVEEARRKFRFLILPVLILIFLGLLALARLL